MYMVDFLVERVRLSSNLTSMFGHNNVFPNDARHLLWQLELTVHHQQQQLQEDQRQIQQLRLLFRQQQLQLQQLHWQLQQLQQQAFSVFDAASAELRTALVGAKPPTLELGNGERTATDIGVQTAVESRLDQPSAPVIQCTEEERCFLLRHGKGREAGLEREFLINPDRMFADFLDFDEPEDWSEDW